MNRPAWIALLLLLVPYPAPADELPPIDCVRLLRQARIAASAGNEAVALEKLVEATERYPDEIEPIVALIHHHREFGGSPEELGRLRAILMRRLADPERPVLPGTLGFLVLSLDAGRDELEAILESVKTRLRSVPDDYDLLKALSVLQGRLDRTEAMHQTVRRMLELNPTNEMLWTCISLDRDRGDWGEVADHLRELVQREPDVPFLRMGYIEALGKTGRYEEILGQLDLLGTQVKPHLFGMELRLTDLLIQLAWDLRDLGKTSEAEAIFRRILELDPDDREARQAILYLYSTPEERQAHKQALQEQWAGESDPELLLTQGTSLLASHDFERAFELLERAGRALPDSELAQFNLGLAAISLKKWEEAALALGRAIELNPSRAESYLNRGLALQYLDRCEEATTVLRRGLELQPDLTQSHYYLYECYRRMGDEEAADRHRKLYNASVEGGR